MVAYIPLREMNKIPEKKKMTTFENENNWNAISKMLFEIDKRFFNKEINQKERLRLRKEIIEKSNIDDKD